MERPVIKEFREQYRFLSNFWSCEVVLEGDDNIYPSVEHAYQASKSCLVDQREKIKKLSSPGKAKIYANRIQLGPYWEDSKVRIMKALLEQKFKNDPLRKLLIDTKNALLIEGNHWHDNFWGSCYCDKCGDKGKNVLGKLLMEIRNEI